MTYQPQNLKRWSAGLASPFDSDSNYVGERPTDCYVAPCGRNRDNEDEPEVASNWEYQEKALEGTSAHVANFGHWACGWYDLMLIPEDDDKALQIADELAERLADYPLLDEDECSNKEVELEWSDWCTFIRDDFQRDLAKKFPAQESYIKTLTGEQLDALCRTLQDRTGQYPEYQGSGDFHYPVDRWIDACEEDDLPPWPKYTHGCKEHAKPTFGCQACADLRDNKARPEMKGQAA